MEDGSTLRPLPAEADGLEEICWRVIREAEREKGRSTSLALSGAIRLVVAET